MWYSRRLKVDDGDDKQGPHVGERREKGREEVVARRELGRPGVGGGRRGETSGSRGWLG